MIGFGHQLARLARAISIAAFLASCGIGPFAAPMPDALAALNACAPSGWAAAHFPFGSEDYGLRDGQIRLSVPSSVAARPKSGATVTFITDWWSVRDHDTSTVSFADGKSATQYRSKAGPPQITTELVTPSGTWQLHAQSEEQYDSVLRCLEPRLNGSR